MKARNDDLKIAMSMPGIGFIAGSTILAEIGDIRDFKTPDKLAAWTGIVSSVYQSANKLSLGRITKQG
jgi:transposase